MGKDQGGGIFKNVQVKLRRDTQAVWYFNNPVLAAGEIGYETDSNRAKVGDGVSAYNQRPYFGESGLVSAYVPYVGATQPVNLGSQSLSGGAASFTGLVNIGNAAATNQKALRVGQGSSYMDFGQVAGAFPGIWLQSSNPSATNYNIAGDSFDMLFNASSSQQIRFNNVPMASIVNQSVGTSSQDFYAFFPPNYTPASLIEHRTVRFNARTRTWSGAGVIAMNREVLIESTVYSSSGALTVTNAYGLYVNAPTAGSNVTITNNWGFGCAGNAAVSGNVFIGSLTSSTAAFLNISAGTTTTPQIQLNQGVAPTSPANGQIWRDANNIQYRDGGNTKSILAARVIGGSFLTPVTANAVEVIINGTTYNLQIVT